MAAEVVTLQLVVHVLCDYFALFLGTVRIVRQAWKNKICTTLSLICVVLHTIR